MTRAQMWVVGALIALALILALAAAGLPPAQSFGRSAQPAPLRGVTLRGRTGLRLLVADRPPFVLDVDTASVTPLAGVAAMTQGVQWIIPVAGRAGVVASGYPDAELHAVRGRPARVSYLGPGSNATATADGRAIWVQQLLRPSQCMLRKVGLDGEVLRAPQPFPCLSEPPGGALGLVVRRTQVVDPSSGRTVLTTRSGILAVADKKLVLAGPGMHFTLLDAATRAERRLRWPSIVGGGIDDAVVDPGGRLVALTAGNPSWYQTGRQVLDIWLLDTTTAKLTHLPGMPAFVQLKFTNLAWTDDGRLVLLARTERDKDVVAVWRPGQKRLALKTVQLPERGDSGSDSFALLR